MRNKAMTTSVGFFMLAGILALVMLAFKVSGLTSYVGNQGYFITAKFDNIGDLKARAPVTIAGVRVGQVVGIVLDPQSFRAVVTLQIAPHQDALPTDTSASIFTQGLLGSNYISLTPGFDTTVLKNGDKIQNTHSALILENLIGEFIYKFNQDDKKK